MNPLISVIIPAHNEERYLGATLEALHRQTYPYFEIIVVANGCRDHTGEAARHHCDRLIDLPERGLGRARNMGGAKARGSLLLFLDADTQLDSDALATIAREFTPNSACGTLRGKPDCPRLLYRLLYLWKNFLHRASIHQGSSGVVFCWRDHFKEVGGFDVCLQVRENSDLIRRLRRLGKYTYVSAAAAVTSMRRYEKRGLSATWDWLKIWAESLVSDLRDRSYEVVR